MEPDLQIDRRGVLRERCDFRIVEFVGKAVRVIWMAEREGTDEGRTGGKEGRKKGRKERTNKQTNKRRF